MTAPTKRLVVADRKTVANEVIALTLVDPTGAELPPWQPGSHVDVRLQGDLIRQYSLCGDVNERHAWRIAVLREPAGRGGSTYVHDQGAVGALLDVGEPRNHFYLATATQYVFIAGGIGITPILPMIRQAAREKIPWHLTYGGRSRASMAFLDELAEFPDSVTIVPQDDMGLIDIAATIGDHRTGKLIYCCGPEPLLDAVEDATLLWPMGSLRVERFAPEKDVVATDADDRAFEVECTRSGIVVSVPPGTSVLDALEDAGIEVMWSCQSGLCGTCETAVAGGVPDHRDSVLNRAERLANDRMMICVSRAKSDRLVLDI